MFKVQFILNFVLIMMLYSGVYSVEEVKTNDSKCLQDMDPGPCRMSLDRFYYNSERNRCELFKFGGCQGNDNKFGFLKTCEDACLQPITKTMTSSTTTSTTATPSLSALQQLNKKNDVL